MSAKVEAEKTKPIGKRLLVELFDVRDKGEVIKPHTWRVWQAGKVKKTGDAVEDIKVGDIVYFRRFSPLEIDGCVTTLEGNILFKEKGKEPQFIYTKKTQRDNGSS